jgi:hypothetical protein
MKRAIIHRPGLAAKETQRPDLPNGPSRTYAVSNLDFPRAVLGKVMTVALLRAHPVVVNFDGNPSKAPAKVAGPTRQLLIGSTGQKGSGS